MKRKPHNGRVNWACKDGAITWQMHTAYTGDWTRHLVEWMTEEGMASDELKKIPWEEIDYDELTQEQIDTWGDEFARFFLIKTKADLMEQSLKRGFMLFPCNNMKDCVEDEQLSARGFWVKLDHPELHDTILYPGAPLILNEAQWSMSRRAPLIGEHNEEIYINELGFSKEQLVLLKEENVI
jgi:crotonobetainyl-CoA:carnitine CoA-transferase CaiB-like acyl-CoA transferase